jgi:rubredoxin
VIAVYLSSIGWSKVLWLQKLLSIFGKGTLAKKKDGTPVVEELPFQTFECEVCQMEMRPARGRAQAIFGKERFRCSRCGAKADAYFDVDDMNDPRAVARKERLLKEQEDDFGDDSDEDDENN